MSLVECNVTFLKRLKVHGHAKRFRFSEHWGHQLAAYSPALSGRIYREQQQVPMWLRDIATMLLFETELQTQESTKSHWTEVQRATHSTGAQKSPP